jgi:predicted amidohydrolase
MDRERLLELLDQPLHLFAALYEFLEPSYGLISDPIYTNLSARERFDRLSDDLLKNISKWYSCLSNHHYLEKVKHMIAKESNFDLLCLALFSALGQYIGKSREEPSGCIDPIRIGDYIISPKPPNPIYDTLKDSDQAIREEYGTGIHDMPEVFKYVHITKKVGLKIDLMKNSVIKRTSTYLKKRLENGLRIAVTSFMGHMDFQVESLIDKWPMKEKTPYCFKCIVNSEEAKSYLTEKILLPCLEKDVAILVLPELTVDDTLLSFLRRWLKGNNSERVSSGKGGILLVVAGSFHVERSADAFYNTSAVLNHAGEVLWAQDKLKRFTLDRNDVKDTPELKEILKISDAGGYEQIHETDTLCCVDMSIGRVSVCICLDYFHKKHTESLRQSSINVFLIPAMTPKNIQFKQAAWYFGNTNLASSFFANSAYIAARKRDGSVSEKGASFFYIPSRIKTYTLAKGEQSDLLIFDFKS